MSSPLPTFPKHHLPEPPASRRRWSTLLLPLLIFVAGLVCGAGLTIVFVVDRLQHAIHHPEAAAARITATLARRLDLNEEQRTQIDAIVVKRQERLTAIRREVQPQVEVELNEFRDEISDVLNESQRERWSGLFEHFRRRWLPPLTQPVSVQENTGQPMPQP